MDPITYTMISGILIVILGTAFLAGMQMQRRADRNFFLDWIDSDERDGLVKRVFRSERVLTEEQIKVHPNPDILFGVTKNEVYSDVIRDARREGFITVREIDERTNNQRRVIAILKVYRTPEE